jgi:hypothetical protein
MRATASSRSPQVVLADDDVLPREGAASLLDRQDSRSSDVHSAAQAAPGERALVGWCRPAGPVGST